MPQIYLLYILILSSVAIWTTYDQKYARWISYGCVTVWKGINVAFCCFECMYMLPAFLYGYYGTINIEHHEVSELTN